MLDLIPKWPETSILTLEPPETRIGDKNSRMRNTVVKDQRREYSQMALHSEVHKKSQV